MVRTKRLAFAVLLLVFALSSPGTASPRKYRPNRILLIIGAQWDDPMSYLVRGGNEFHDIVSLLKNWGIPFDILRIDQQRLDPNDFLGYDGKPLYGAVLWDADPTAFMDQNYELLADAAQKWNIGLVALSNRIQQPVLESLLGLHYKGYHDVGQPIVVEAPDHYLLRGLPDPLDTNDDPRIALTARGVFDVEIPWKFELYKKRVIVEARGAQVLATQGDSPQITVHDLGAGNHAIWIGSDYLQFLHYQALRTVLRRALALAVGYELGNYWSKDAILEMDDLGCASNSWLESWHYPTLSEPQMEKFLIEPLAAHQARLTINVCSGFVDRNLRAIVPSFQQVFTDAFGTKQDYISTRRGLEEGLSRGVFEVQSHGWTHMQPDLDSPPGPWWDAPLYEEKAEVGWYREFGDVRRGKEIPGSLQRFHLERAIEWFKKEFGVTPLSALAGGSAISKSFANNTTIIAARLGFGWFGEYEGPDLAIEMIPIFYNQFGGTTDAPLVIWIPPDGHDRGISQHPEEFPKIFDQLSGWRYISMNGYIGYMHAKVASAGGDSLVLTVTYDDHYCSYFRDHPSRWHFEMPGVSGVKNIIVDGRAQSVMFENGLAIINIPAGLGTHTIDASSAW
jgi:hypothetical protein